MQRLAMFRSFDGRVNLDIENY